MTQLAHTPEPWVFNEKSGYIESLPEGKPLGRIVCYISGANPERFVNAHLIEAAPHLLKALERMVAVANWHDTIQSEEEFDAMIAASEAAIRKAKGEL